MKRFWKSATAVKGTGGWSVELDGRPVRTPGRALLEVPEERLARAVAAEWDEAGETINPREMPLTGLANAAIDRVQINPDEFAATLSRYGESDLLAYRAETPQELAERQADVWEPLLQWARRRYDVDFVVTQGVSFVPQAPNTIARLAQAVAALDPFWLAGLSPLVTIGGSLVAALAVAEGDHTPESVWEAVSLDEAWQLEKWGSDAEAEQAVENRRRDFFAADRKSVV